MPNYVGRDVSRVQGPEGILSSSPTHCSLGLTEDIVEDSTGQRLVHAVILRTKKVQSSESVAPPSISTLAAGQLLFLASEIDWLLRGRRNSADDGLSPLAGAVYTVLHDRSSELEKAWTSREQSGLSDWLSRRRCNIQKVR